MQPKYSLLHGQPYISGNAFGHMAGLTFEESTHLAFPDFTDKITLKKVYDTVDAPFGGHVLEFKNGADETWFRLKYG